MDLEKFSLGDTCQRFFELPRKHLMVTVIASLLLGILCYVIVNIGLSEVIWQNSHPIRLLAAEQLLELGPDYAGESRHYVEMIDRYYAQYYAALLEQRKFAGILPILYPALSPEKALASVRKELEKAANEQEAKKAIWEAGLASNRFCMLSRRFSRSPIEWFTLEHLPPRLLQELEANFDNFHVLVSTLDDAQPVEIAETQCANTCRDGRRTLLVLSLARLGYSNKEKIQRFLSDLQQARNFALCLAEKHKSYQKVLTDRARNMGLRINVVQAILDNNDMDRAAEFLDEEIERAIEDHKQAHNS